MIITAHTTNSDINLAMASILEQVGEIKATLVLYFASSSYNPDDLSHAFYRAFPGATTLGCTSSGEIVTGNMLKGSIVAMAMNEETAPEVVLSIINGVSSRGKVAASVSSLGEQIGSAVIDLNPEEWVGIVLVDGLRFAEEQMMETIGDISNVHFIGGSAGDDLNFNTTYIMANGCAYTDAAVLALFKPRVSFDILKTQSFIVKPVTLVATKVNQAERTVIEFNHRPAVEAYAEAVGCDPTDLANQFMSHPLGLLVGDEPFVRSPQQIVGTSIVFYCQVLEGAELALLESRDIVEDTRLALQKKIEHFGEPGGIINFHCILRTLELEAKKQTEAYADLFSGIPTVGFSTYGEQYEGHINQTSTILLLGKEASS
jgi:hypothetical protein